MGTHITKTCVYLCTVLNEQLAGLAIWYIDLQHIAYNYSNSYDHALVAVVLVLCESRIELRRVYFSYRAKQ